MLSSVNFLGKINVIGRAKEKLLTSKMISILTPSKDSDIKGGKNGITFENLLIFLATVSNIDVPYRSNVKNDNVKLKNLKDFRQDQMRDSQTLMLDSEEDEKENHQHLLKMRMSQSGLLQLLPPDSDCKTPFASKSKYKYGYFNNNGTLIFTEQEREKIHKEFIVFASNRRDYLSELQKQKAEEKKNQVLNEFDHIPKINKNSKFMPLHVSNFGIAHRSYNLDQMIHGDLPVYENLLKKGEEYKLKHQIRKGLEANLDQEGCTFHPIVNPKSHELAHSSTRVEDRLYSDHDHSKACGRGCDKNSKPVVVQLSEKLKMYKDSLRNGSQHKKPNSHSKNSTVVFKSPRKGRNTSSKRTSELDFA